MIPRVVSAPRCADNVGPTGRAGVDTPERAHMHLPTDAEANCGADMFVTAAKGSLR